MNIWNLCVDLGNCSVTGRLEYKFRVICHQHRSGLCLRVTWKIVALCTNERILLKLNNRKMLWFINKGWSHAGVFFSVLYLARYDQKTAILPAQFPRKTHGDRSSHTIPSVGVGFATKSFNFQSGFSKVWLEKKKKNQKSHQFRS